MTSMVLALVLVGVAGAARGAVALLPRTPAATLAQGNAGTDELAAVAQGDGFALIWDATAATPPSSETLFVQRLDLDGEESGPAVEETVNQLTAVDAVATGDGLVLGFLTQNPFESPAIALRRYEGAGLDLTGTAVFEDTGVEAFRLFALGEDSAAALYGVTATFLVLGSPGSAEEVALPLEDDPALAGIPAAAGELFVFTADPNGGLEPTTLVRYRVSAGVVESGPDAVVTDSFLVGAPILSTTGGGRHLLAWRRPDSFPGPGRHYAAMFVETDGSADGEPFGLSLAGRENAELREVALDGGGLVWTLWQDQGDLVLAAFAPGETSAMPLVVESGALRDFDLAVTSSGSALVAWIDEADAEVRGQVFEECSSFGGEGGTTLCLQRGRFLVELEFETPQGETGQARAVPTRSVESGLFWFFTPDNWEFLVKGLDGCEINGRWWIFAAPTTDVGFTLRVTDTVSQMVRTYENPVGTLPTVINDTSAFVCALP